MIKHGDYDRPSLLNHARRFPAVSTPWGVPTLFTTPHLSRSYIACMRCASYVRVLAATSHSSLACRGEIHAQISTIVLYKLGASARFRRRTLNEDLAFLAFGPLPCLPPANLYTLNSGHCARSRRGGLVPPLPGFRF